MSRSTKQPKEWPGVLVVSLIFITIMWWDSVSIILQTIAAALSVIYCFFGGTGMYKAASSISDLLEISTRKFAAAIWLLFMFLPTVATASFPSSNLTEPDLARILSLGEAVVKVSKATMFIYGFGYVVLVLLGWVVLTAMRDPETKNASWVYLLCAYVLVIGIVTLFITLQVAGAFWFPSWIPSVNSMSILPIVWCLVSTVGMIIQALTPGGVQKVSDTIRLMPSHYRMLIAVGFLLFVGPTYLYFWNPSFLLYIIGTAFIIYPVLHTIENSSY
ncbi:MAG: hypothetical protein KGY80_14015 [Candidatus Thorarchaeota archaeon]|nr:hypothetical protein [Candidatus Thorarchaeota archaeon]